jgi:MYXO-CTERM domain-containing protein
VRTRTRVIAASLAAVALTAAPEEARAFCPCYSPSSAYNTHDCAIPAYNGLNPTTAEWNDIFNIVAQGPRAWGDKGPSVINIGQGCSNPEPYHTVPAHFPCELLKALTMVETGWRQFCVPDLPSDQVGGSARTIISFDCGYGVGQVTSGMHVDETPNFDRARVASDPMYNLAASTQIIALKWKATKCVGDNQPTIIEDWYSATWAYNGLSYVNNPNNPNYDANRGVWNPKVGGGAPYQEKVFGWIEYTSKWAPTALAYPNIGDIGDTGTPAQLPEPDCASPTNCSTKRPVHKTACIDMVGSGGGAGGSGGGGGGAGGGGTGGSGGAGGSGTGGSGGADGSGGTEFHDKDEDGTLQGGCSCRVGAEDASSTMAGSGLGLIGLVVLRRRRARRA